MTPETDERSCGVFVANRIHRRAPGNPPKALGGALAAPNSGEPLDSIANAILTRLPQPSPLDVLLKVMVSMGLFAVIPTKYRVPLEAALLRI